MNLFTAHKKVFLVFLLRSFTQVFDVWFIYRTVNISSHQNRWKHTYDMILEHLPVVMVIFY